VCTVGTVLHHRKRQCLCPIYHFDIYAICVKALLSVLLLPFIICCDLLNDLLFIWVYYMNVHHRNGTRVMVTYGKVFLFVYFPQLVSVVVFLFFVPQHYMYHMYVYIVHVPYVCHVCHVSSTLPSSPSSWFWWSSSTLCLRCRWILFASTTVSSSFSACSTFMSHFRIAYIPMKNATIITTG
jgi:hypothetical protein